MSAVLLADNASVPPHKLAERNLERMGAANSACVAGPQAMNFHSPDSQWQMVISALHERLKDILILDS